MARTKVDIITCDRCGRTLEEGDVRTIEFSILYHDPHPSLADSMETVGIIHGAAVPAPPPTRYVEVCARCDKLLRRLAADAATPSKPGRPRKEKEDAKP